MVNAHLNLVVQSRWRLTRAAPDESAGRGSQVISDEVRPPREIWRRVTPPDPGGARGISILRLSSVLTTDVPGGRCTQRRRRRYRVEFYAVPFSVFTCVTRRKRDTKLSFRDTRAHARTLPKNKRVTPARISARGKLLCAA